MLEKVIELANFSSERSILSLNETFEITSSSTTFRLIINSVYVIIGLLGIFCNGVVLFYSVQKKNKHSIFMSGKNF